MSKFQMCPECSRGVPTGKVWGALRWNCPVCDAPLDDVPIEHQSPSGTCPGCRAVIGDRAKACLFCGFNATIGDKRPLPGYDFAWHWMFGGALVWRVLFLLVPSLPLAVAGLYHIFNNRVQGGLCVLAMASVWCLINVPAVGTFFRISVTRRRDQSAVLTRTLWVAFVPCWRRRFDLGRYDTVVATKRKFVGGLARCFVELFSLNPIYGWIGTDELRREWPALLVLGPGQPPIELMLHRKEKRLRALASVLQEVWALDRGTRSGT